MLGRSREGDAREIAIEQTLVAELGILSDTGDGYDGLVEFRLQGEPLGLVLNPQIGGIQGQRADPHQDGRHLIHARLGGLRQGHACLDVLDRLRDAHQMVAQTIGQDHAGRIFLGSIDAYAR